MRNHVRSLFARMRKVSEFGPEIHTADQLMTPRGKATEHQQPHYNRKTFKVKQLALSLSYQDHCKTRKHDLFIPNTNLKYDKGKYNITLVKGIVSDNEKCEITS